MDIPPPIREIDQKVAAILQANRSELNNFSERERLASNIIDSTKQIELIKGSYQSEIDAIRKKHRSEMEDLSFMQIKTQSELHSVRCKNADLQNALDLLAERIKQMEDDQRTEAMTSSSSLDERSNDENAIEIVLARSKELIAPHEETLRELATENTVPKELYSYDDCLTDEEKIPDCPVTVLSNEDKLRGELADWSGGLGESVSNQTSPSIPPCGESDNPKQTEEGESETDESTDESISNASSAEDGDESSLVLSSDTEESFRVKDPFANVESEAQKVNLLQARIKQLEKMHQEEIKEKYEKEKITKEKHQQMKDALSSLVGALGEMTKSNQTSTNRVAELKSVVEEKEDEIELLKQKIESESVVQQAQRGYKSIVSTKLAEANAHNAALKELIKDLWDKLHHSEVNKNIEVKQVTNSLRYSRSQYKDQVQMNKDLKTELAFNVRALSEMLQTNQASVIRVAELESIIEKKTVQVQNVKVKSASRVAQMTSALQRNEEFLQNLQVQIRDSNRETKGQVEELNDRLEAKEKKLQELNIQLAQSEAALEEKGDELLQLKEQIASDMVQHEVDRDSLSSVSSKLLASETCIAAKNEDLMKIKRDLNSIRDENKEVLARNMVLKSSLNEALSAKQDLVIKNKDLKDSNRRLNARTSGVVEIFDEEKEEELQKLKDDIASNAVERQVHHGLVTIIKTKLAESDARNTMLRIDLNAALIESDAMVSRNKELEASLEEVLEEKQDVTYEHQKLKRQVKDSSTSQIEAVKKLKTDCQAARRHNIQVVARNKDLERYVDQLLLAKQGMILKQDELERKLDEYKRALDNTKQVSQLAFKLTSRNEEVERKLEEATEGLEQKKELEKLTERLQGSLEAKDSEIAGLRLGLKDSDSTIRRLENNVTRIALALTEAKELAERLQEAIEAKDCEIGALRRGLKDNDSTIQLLEGKVTRTSHALNEAKETIHTLEEENNGLETANQTLEEFVEEKDSLIARQQISLEEAEAVIQTWKEKVSTTENALTDAQDELKKIKMTMSEKLKTLTSDLDKARHMRKELEDDIYDARAKNDDLNSQLEDAQQELDRLQKKNSGELQSLATELDLATTRYKKLKRQYEKERNDHQQALEEAESKFHTMEQYTEMKEFSSHYARTLNDEVMKRNQELETALGEAKEKLSSSQIEEAQETISMLQGELKQYKRALEDEMFCNRTIKDAIVTLNAENDKLLAEKKLLSKELEESRLFCPE